MTRYETGQVMNLLTAAYPRYYAGIDEKRSKDALNMWATLFANDDMRIVLAAVRAFIDSDEKGFPPVPGQIKAKMRLILDPEEMTEMEAWNLVANALKNSAYGATEEFEKFPPVVKRIVGSPGQLREWGMMDSETVHSVVSSNFQRSYKAVAEKEREYRKLPGEVRDLVQSLRLSQAPIPELPEKQKEPKQIENCPFQDAVPMPEKLRELIRGQNTRRETSNGPRRSREETIAILRGEQT